METLIIKRPIIAEIGVSEATLTSILARIASINGSVGVVAGAGDDQTLSAYLAGQSAEADFTRDYYRDGYVEASSPTLLPAWAHTRTGAATYQNAAGLIESYATGVPLINDRGLLVQHGQTNRVLKSAALDAVIWEKVAGGTGSAPTVSANTALAPDGTMTADVITFDLNGGITGSDFSLCTQSGIAVTNGAPYTTSRRFRASTPCTILLQGIAGSGYEAVEVTAEWSRPYVTQVAVGTTGTFVFGLQGGLGASDVAAVETVSGQVDEGLYPTSDIPTDGDPVTRGADSATAFPIGPTGTLMMEFEVPLYDGEDHYLALIDDHVMLYVTSGVVSSSAPGSLLSVSGPVLAAGSIARAAISWEPGSRSISVNGGLVATAPRGFPSADGILIGGAAKEFGAPIRRVIRFNVATPDDRLRVLAGGEAPDASLARWERVTESTGIGGRDSASTFAIGGRRYISGGFIEGGAPRHDIYVTENSRDFVVVDATPGFEVWSKVAAIGTVMYAWGTTPPSVEHPGPAPMEKSLDGGLTWIEIIASMPFVQAFEAPHIVTSAGELIVYHDGVQAGAAGFWAFDPVDEDWALILASPFGRQVTNLEMAELNGSIYLIGGVDGATPNVPPEIGYPGATTLNWSWRSDDWCRSVVKLTDNMNMQPRRWGTSIGFGAWLYRIGGYNPLVGNDTNFSQTFRSRDAIHWELLEVSQTFTARHAGNAWPMDGKLYLGMGKGSTTMDDVWVLQLGPSA